MYWSPQKSRALPQVFDRMIRLPPVQAWGLVLGITGTVAVFDLLTGTDIWVGPVYLLAICSAAWSLGWVAAHLTGITCMGLAFAINGLSLYPYGGVDLWWNLVTRYIAISIVIAAFVIIRRAYIREWWLARTDNLTGALNRQAFFELAPLAVDMHRWRLMLYVDLDGLKKINDNQGHAAGDRWLRTFGMAARRMIRQHDLFARVGGDEFIIFMQVKDEAAARAVAKRLHKAMNAIAVGDKKLNCSLGGLVVPPGKASVDDLVRAADSLMYAAKLRGACLEMGTASEVARFAGGRARAVTRRLRTPAVNDCRVERREDAETFVGEIAPF